MPVSDTIKVVDRRRRRSSPRRIASTLVAVQTPQAFRADMLRKAHAEGGEGTDDAALVEAIGGRVVTVAGRHRATARSPTAPTSNGRTRSPVSRVWARRTDLTVSDR